MLTKDDAHKYGTRAGSRMAGSGIFHDMLLPEDLTDYPEFDIDIEDFVGYEDLQ